MPRTRCTTQRAPIIDEYCQASLYLLQRLRPRRWRTARRFAAATITRASHKTLSCNVQLQPPEARLRVPINGFIRVDGIDDVPPGPQAVENAAPRAVCVRLARAWDSLTSARPSQLQLLFDSSSKRVLTFYSSTSAKSLYKQSL